MEIPSRVAKERDTGIIPRGVAELAQEQEDPEGQPYLISFAKYNEKVCEIASLSSNKARKAIGYLKQIGMRVHSIADFQKENLDRIPIRREGEYLKLYNRLAEDIDLKEMKLQADGRIFYFDIEPEKTFYVVAITENHLETRKIRRK